mmetsp:Transcript_27692/g.55714  ORF Transcript_27692/g.55714 Transcript_27692/m.55714 type:complete len:151 (-) Transcript_27692:67-519(-)
MFPPLSSLKSEDRSSAPEAPGSAAVGATPSSGQEIAGIKRVTRHPSLWSLGLLGAGTALSTPFAPEIVFFSMPCVFAFIGGAHQDYRHRRGWGGSLTPEVDEQTSHVPFVALVKGRQSWEEAWHELKQENAAAAMVLGVVCALLRLRRII